MLFDIAYLKKQKLIEKLLRKHKNMILSSKYQNCCFRGIPLWQVFGVEKKSNKSAPNLDTLINILINKTFLHFNYNTLMKYKDILKSYPDVYIKYGNQNNKDYIKIKDILSYFDNQDGDCVVEYYMPTFFSRYYKLKWKNKKQIQYVPTAFNINLVKFRQIFKIEKDILQEDIDISIFDKIKIKIKNKGI